MVKELTEIPQGFHFETPEGFEPSKRNPAIQAMLDGQRVIKIPESPNPIKSAYFGGERTLSTESTQNLLISSWALFSPMRQFVIDKVKAPLQKAIEGAKTFSDIAGQLFYSVKMIPNITKKNTCFINSHILIDKEEMFFKYHHNLSRDKMCQSAFKLGRFEYEHDSYWAWLMDWLLIELAMELAKGNWRPRFLKFPYKARRGTPTSPLEGWTGPDLPDIETIRQNMRDALAQPLPPKKTGLYFPGLGAKKEEKNE